MMAVASKIFLTRKVNDRLTKELIAANINISLTKFIRINVIATIILSFIILLFFRGNLEPLERSSFILALIGYWLLSLLISLVIILFFAYSLITVRKVKRKKEVELVLPDYLQLVSANLNAGMPIDQALWYAVRERFGILNEEIEIIARKTLSGEDLEQALVEFSEKYDSEILKKSIVLLIEGLKAGGELSLVVNKIAWGIKEDQILSKEIAAEVTTYTIFIIVAALFAAPLLYALSNRMIIIMSEITSKIDVQNIVGVSSQIPIKSFAQGINPNDFKIFSFIGLGITAIISAMIISAIKKGSIKAGIRSIPLFLIISYLVFLTASVILSQAFKGIA